MPIEAQGRKETTKAAGWVEPVKPASKGLESEKDPGGDRDSREPKPKPKQAWGAKLSAEVEVPAARARVVEEGEVISDPAKANASHAIPEASKPRVTGAGAGGASASAKSSSSSSAVPPKASHTGKPSPAASSEKAKPPRASQASSPLSRSPTATNPGSRTVGEGGSGAAASSLPLSVSSKAKSSPAATHAVSKAKSASATKAKASKASSSSLGSKNAIKAPSSSSSAVAAASKPLPTSNGVGVGGSGNGSKAIKKGARKKRKATGPEDVEDPKKIKKVKRKKEKEEEKKPEKVKKPRKQAKKPPNASPTSVVPVYPDLREPRPMTREQLEVQKQLCKALEEDQYSANGSVVDTDTDDEDHQYVYKGESIRLDRAHLLHIAKKCNWLGDGSGTGSVVTLSTRGLSGSGRDNNAANDDDDDDEEEGILYADGTTHNGGTSSKKKSSRSKKKGRNQYSSRNSSSASSGGGFRIDDKSGRGFADGSKPRCIGVIDKGMDAERDEGSIFGQTTGSSQFTWVECDKCKKWRRLRGIVDERKLPPKWYCTMNKNDPDRARCSAPEEEYEAAHTPESAADARTRKHLRVWVRRLQCNEQYESRLPTLTRGKKRAVASSSKEPYEWVRCCNPSCGKWRAILRIMDAKQNVIDRTSNGEWYCVMNTWDEKTASCAAPQENLPAVGCPPWVMQDEN